MRFRGVEAKGTGRVASGGSRVEEVVGLAFGAGVGSSTLRAGRMAGYRVKREVLT